MNILEAFVAGKHNDSNCEDGYVITPDYIAVIDGSTSKSSLPPQKNNLSRGQIAMQTVCDFVRNAAPDCTLIEFCREVTTCTRRLYTTLSLDADGILPFDKTNVIAHMSQHPEDRYCCSAIVYSRHHNAIWMIGDCQALVLEKDSKTPLHLTNEKPEEAILAEKRSRILNQALAEGARLETLRHNDIGRAAILPALKAAMSGQNRDYAVIDGFDIPLDKVKVYQLLPETKQIVLASDGFPHLYETLSASEVYLSQCLREDPLCITLNKATKGLMHDAQSFDDRTYIRFEP